MAAGIKSLLPSEPAPTSTVKEKITHSKTKSSTLLHHSLVTSDPDALKFHAAASQQLQIGQPHDASAAAKGGDDLLIVSPYNEPGHLLDLKTLDTPNQLLAKALTIFKPIRDDYATAPYTESFNWEAVIELLRDLCAAEGYRWQRQKFYVVTFRSRLFPDVDMQLLHDLDVHSHREATASGGLLKYWFGTKDENHRNLATCIWRSKADARLGGTGPWHQRARAAARDFYERIVFTTLKLVIDDGAAAWEISDWTEADD
ncbi:hypothetical protein M432DRAFT_605757 [Thermoascus aurantiacus ATCC 26904]